MQRHCHVKKGEEVVVVNIEKTVISGNPKRIVEVYEGRRSIQNKSNPTHSPKWPRRPDYLFKRIMQGMVPKTRKGEIVLKKFQAHIGVPAEFAEKAKKAETTKKLASNLLCRSITLGEVCAQLGWK